MTCCLCALLALPAAVGAQAGAGAFDGSKPFLCALTTVMECDGSGQCERQTAEMVGAPTFIRVDVGSRVVTAGADRRAALQSSARLNGRLILHGGENGRGWSATIHESTGQMSAAVVDNDHTFSLFGACTLP
ncbi:MAG: hypothetical protein ACREM3_29990 [Candidatus Rokuibacteriota bacterium]